MLYLVPTPIGNLGDITLRALETLRNADLIYAEDTRRTRQLLNYFEIKTPLASYHEHNRETAGTKILENLKSGMNIALVSDAGMPCISDPGLDLVSRCISETIEFTILPGATAFSVAYAGSGMNGSSFCFMGFLPKTKKHKLQSLFAIARDQRIHIFYESPHALPDTLRAIHTVLGNRKICLARELTKLHEEYRRGTVEEMLAYFERNDPRGEYVIVLAGADPDDENPSGIQAETRDAILEEFQVSGEPQEGGMQDADRDELIKTLLLKGKHIKEIAESIARHTGCRKKQIYQRAVELQDFLGQRQ